jgi:two-component system phosphate regulon sensor histidine kinase PhoR
MFRRLLVNFAVLALAVAIGASAVIYLACPDPDMRGNLYVGLGVVFVLSLGLGVGLSASLSYHFTRPLNELITAVERLEMGAESPRVYSRESDEVSLLGQTFNRMSEHLGQRIAALEEDRQKMRAILSGMVEGVVALDGAQRILFANDRARTLLDLANTPLVGRSLYEVVRNRQLLDAVRHALSSPEPHKEELAWIGATQRSLTVHAARIPGDPPRGAVVVLHDTTELRRLERLRQEFVANVSHELKTPLSVIKACTETLIDGAVEDVEHRGRFLGNIAAQSDRLHALILDMLSLARIESGEELFDFKVVGLRATALDCLARHLPRAEGRRQALHLEPGGEGVEAWADPEAVNHILDNLLDNAVKYTPEGGEVRVRVWADGGQALIEVRDNGIGIPAADLPRVFERFYRVDRARSREMGGTGLGLSIVKHLIQAMHGTVSATSEPGVGTTFTISLPHVVSNPAAASWLPAGPSLQ